ncbi:MAG TPA: tRNA (N(6)-L-threonylcarbamoyladenosine(37)-C(2))-methylthiotransferase MtaB [Firmicutes bacterium]|nr:tRNA (N(6)-L-threonylcarbamoyladenosine(37)-C(2))-methylthiotransferase MtaB [Bacillota bacterium]
MSTVAAYTLGCKVNQYDTEGVLSLFSQKGYEIVPFEEKADIYIINTCTVTAESDKKSRQIIRRAKDKNPLSIVVVMGCYTQTEPSKVAQIEGVDIIIGTSGRDLVVKLVEEYRTKKEQIIKITTADKFEDLPATYHERTRAYVKIQDGCDNFCSYCKIPYSRGRIRSRLPESILEEVANLASSGTKEIIFTGIHIGAYGRDLEGWNLARILKEALKIPGYRLRLSSIEPLELDDEIIELLDYPNFCRHLHIPLQSGTDKILKAMNRKYDTETYSEIIQKVKDYSPLGLTTDIIVGFPGESEEDFIKTCEFVKEMGFTRLHVFPFSRRKGTKAYSLPNQIPRKERSRRAKELIAIGQDLEDAYHQKNIGRIAEVVVEQEALLPETSKRGFSGTTEDYIKVYIDKPGNGFVQVELEKVYSNGVLGRTLKSV